MKFKYELKLFVIIALCCIPLFIIWQHALAINYQTQRIEEDRNYDELRSQIENKELPNYILQRKVRESVEDKQHFDKQHSWLERTN